MADLAGSSWKRDGNEVYLVTKAKEPFFVSALDLYRSEIAEDNQDYPRLSESTSLTISKSCAQIEACFAMDPERVPGAAVIWFEAKYLRRHEIMKSFRSDHVIIDEVWHPVMPGGEDFYLKVKELYGKGVPFPTTIKISSFRNLFRDPVVSQGLSMKPEIPEIILDQLEIDETVNPSDAVPLDIKANLFGYQETGVSWLVGLVRQELGGILGDTMGLGKTLQIIGLFAQVMPSTNRPSLVVCPPTLLANWEREIQKFCPDLVALVHHGSQRTGIPAGFDGAQVVLAGYETVRNDIALMKNVDWAIVVLDEAQAIKNPESLRTQAVNQLPREVGIAVTGTPLENSLLDLWSLSDFVHPGLLGERADFQRLYADDSESAQRLGDRIAPLILRRRVEDLAGDDFPALREIPHALLMNEDEADEYEGLRLNMKEATANERLGHLTRIRQFCTLPSIVAGCAARSAKKQRLFEIIDEVRRSGEKAIVFASFTSAIDDLHACLSSASGLDCFTLDGRVPMEERQQLIDLFEADSRSSVLVANPTVAGAGLNITAANHVIHFNLEWNPAKVDQASARCYRRGQEKSTVFVHYLVYAGTIEEVIRDRLDLKRDLAERAAEGHDGRDRIEHDEWTRMLSASPLRGWQSL